MTGDQNIAVACSPCPAYGLLSTCIIWSWIAV